MTFPGRIRVPQFNPTAPPSRPAQLDAFVVCDFLATAGHVEDLYEGADEATAGWLDQVSLYLVGAFDAEMEVVRDLFDAAMEKAMADDTWAQGNMHRAFERAVYAGEFAQYAQVLLALFEQADAHTPLWRVIRSQQVAAWAKEAQLPGHRVCLSHRPAARQLAVQAPA